MDTSPAPVQDVPKSQIPLFLTAPRLILLLVAIVIMAAGVFVFATAGNYPGGVTGYTPINLSQKKNSGYLIIRWCGSDMIQIIRRLR